MDDILSLKLVLAFGLLVLIVGGIIDFLDDGKFWKHFIIPLLVGASLVIQYLIGIRSLEKEETNSKQQAARHQEVINAITQTTNNIGVKGYKGYSVQLAVEIYKTKSSNSRKYLYDSGESENRNRISLYLDSKDNFVFEIIDRNGIAHTKIAQNRFYNFDYNSLLFLIVEYGYNDLISYMRFKINTQTYGPEIFSEPLPLDLDKLSENETYFASMSNNQGSSGNVVMTSRGRLLSDTQILAYMKAVDQYIKSMDRISRKYNQPSYRLEFDAEKGSFIKTNPK